MFKIYYKVQMPVSGRRHSLPCGKARYLEEMEARSCYEELRGMGYPCELLKFTACGAETLV